MVTAGKHKMADADDSGEFYNLHEPVTGMTLSFIEAVDVSNNLTENTARDSDQDFQVDLIPSMVQEGLSCLGYISSGTTLSYLKLSLSNRKLTDINIISSFVHLKHVDLSHNELKDLLPLSSLRHLTSINVSHNHITNMMTFAPPPNLQSIDYSYNEIEEFPQDLGGFSSLTKLVIDGNQLTSLCGLSALVSLTFLSLSDNRIDSLNGLDSLPIKTLIVANNNITRVTGIQSLHLLEAIDLSNNRISSLEGLCGFDYLNEINVEENQIVDFKEIYHLEDLHQLTGLNLKKNPVQNDPSYKQFVLVTLKKILVLDGQNIIYHERIAARNRYNPSMDLLTSQNHMQHVVKATKKQARLNFSTLSQLDEPYPMLVLCGPACSGKEAYAQQLVEEFPSFFGLGVSHTTRPQGADESHGRDYYFINDTTFKRAVDAGEFIQTSFISGYWYGLTMAAVEQVAQQGLACVCHLTLEGVLTLKRCHFEPRYILLLPLNKQVHEQRIQSYGQRDEVGTILRQVEEYLKIHRTRPGFFDATINTDRLNEGYNILRTVVMAYGGISPDTPLTLSLSASRPTTRQTSSSLSSYGIIIDDDGGTSNPGTAAVTSTVLPGEVSVSRSAPIAGHLTSNEDQRIQLQQLNAFAQSWSRPSTTGSTGSYKRDDNKVSMSDCDGEEIVDAASDGITSDDKQYQD